MSYNPEDYVLDWRRIGAGYGVAAMALFGLFTLDVAYCVWCGSTAAYGT